MGSLLEVEVSVFPETASLFMSLMSVSGAGINFKVGVQNPTNQAISP